MQDAISPKRTRKFRDENYYTNNSGTYYLLPFRFTRLNAAREVLVNEVGDYLKVPVGKGLSHEEIAEELGLAASTVNNHITDARKFIRLYLSRHLDIAVLIIMLHRF